tara:strand:- start:379 stop:750 length:372 start_codon:yes stop_codon:yes gene_type:complete
MSVFQYKTGLGNSSAYQVSAVPYIVRGTLSSNDVTEISFSNVTNFIQIYASKAIKVGFSSLGISANDNYFQIDAGVSDIYHWRLSSLFIQRTAGSTTYEIRAGVTLIDSAELSNNWSGSAGVG